MSIRLVVLGGSAVSTVQLVDALADWPGGEARCPDGLELVLHGRSDRLEAVAAACRMRAAAAGLALGVRSERDVAAALDGAGVVVNQIRAGGLEARSLDESFPQLAGIPGEETLGPGGLACAVRSVAALRPFWAAVARSAPQALLINLTNPAGIVQQAARAEFGLEIVTVCDSPLVLLDGVARRLGSPPADVRARYVGMNHVGWYVPAAAAELGLLGGLADGLDPGLPALHEDLPVPYLRYYAQPDRMLAAQRDRPTRAEELLRMQGETMDSYRQGTVPQTWQRKAPWYSLAVVPLADAWLNGSDQVLIVGLPNAGRVPWLPSDVIVEGPARARVPGGLEPEPVVALPDLPRGLLARHASYERLAVRALAGEPTATGLTRALLANPMVSSLDQASALATAILRSGPGPRA
jgi:6-phospho-beta-glucosidase